MAVGYTVQWLHPYSIGHIQRWLRYFVLLQQPIRQPGDGAEITTLSGNFANSKIATLLGNFAQFETTTLSGNCAQFEITTLSSNFAQAEITTLSGNFAQSKFTTLSGNFAQAVHFKCKNRYLHILRCFGIDSAINLCTYTVISSTPNHF